MPVVRRDENGFCRLLCLRLASRVMTSQPQMPPPPDADQRRAAKPVVVYALDRLPAYDAAFYDNARAGMTKTGETIVPPREGRAFDVPAGHFFRIVSIEGPQVGDLNLWRAGNLAERFFSGKTRALNATHVTTGGRLWSALPYLRPMATVHAIRSVGTASTPTARAFMTSLARAATPTRNG